MDAMKALKVEMERKRKLAAQLSASSESTKTGGLKFIRQSDLAEIQEKERQQRQAEYEEQEQQRKKSKYTADVSSVTADSRASIISNDSATGTNKSKIETIRSKVVSEAAGAVGIDSVLKKKLNELTLPQIQQRLRSFGRPITLYGEITREERLQRLLECYESMLSLDDSSLLDGFGQDDDGRFDDLAARASFAPAERSCAIVSSSSSSSSSSSASVAITNAVNEKDDQSSDEEEEGEGDTTAVKATEKPKWYLDRNVKYSQITRYSKEKIIYKYFKGLLKRWGYFLSKRSEQEKNTSKGKLETQGHNRCKEYLQEFFKMCLHKTLPPTILPNILAIVTACEEGDFVLAHEWYIKTAIGNSAWPIGVTMVGIHERSGREKLTKVAHVMNNELSRKYLTSMKRLMSFAQSQADDVAPSRKVG